TVEIGGHDPQSLGCISSLNISYICRLCFGHHFTDHCRCAFLHGLINKLMSIYLRSLHGYESGASIDLSAIEGKLDDATVHIPVGRHQRHLIQYVLQYFHQPNTSLTNPFAGTWEPGARDWFLTLPLPEYCTLKPLFSKTYKASFNIIPVTSGTTFTPST